MKTIPENIIGRTVKIEIGSILQICRWDWNGINSQQKVISINPLDEFSAKIKTKNGSIIFDTRKETYFKWSGKSKFDWERKYQTNVSFKNSYIELKVKISKQDTAQKKVKYKKLLRI